MSSNLIVSHRSDHVVVEIKSSFDSETSRWALRRLQAILSDSRGAFTKGLIIFGMGGEMRQVPLPTVIPGAEVIALVPVNASIPDDWMAGSPQGRLLYSRS